MLSTVLPTGGQSTVTGVFEREGYASNDVLTVDTIQTLQVSK